MRMRLPQKVLGNQLMHVIKYIFHNNLDRERVRPQALAHRHLPNEAQIQTLIEASFS